MPPRRNAAAKAKAPSPPPPILNGCNIALSGSFPGMSQAVLKSCIEGLGATALNTVAQETTHLIVSQASSSNPSAKVKTAHSLGALVVSVQWLLDCVKDNVRKSEAAYTVPSSSTAPSSAVATPPPPSASGSTKKRAASHSDDDPPKAQSSQPAPKKSKASKPASKKSDAKIFVPVDECCTLGNAVVRVDDDGVIWDASLNQTNSQNNNNKFYRIQVLCISSGAYKTWTRWGRVGEHGQSSVLGNGTLDDAVKNFCKKFKDKSGIQWADRAEDPKPGKYAFIERSYAPDSDSDAASDSPVDGDDDKKAVLDTESLAPPECSLAKPVQDLMELIFNRQYFAATMTDLNYDANKLPLGKLSKTTISRGFQALKDLAALLDDASRAQSVHGMTLPDSIELLSNQYYTLIPHAFGRNRPPIIHDNVLLKKEIELLESLSDMKDAELLMKVSRVKSETVHQADRHFSGLGMKEMTPLDRGSVEFKELANYLSNTRGTTHHVKYQVQEIFRIEREGEQDRFDGCNISAESSDRRLLWHGSRVTNFGGILGQGLRIAPPEAPVSGYMFGKGIYLADMSSKSANYCCSHISGGTALLLLCEANLGSPMQELVHASYTAGEDAKKSGLYSTWGKGRMGPLKWKDAGCIHEDLNGVTMPDVSSAPGDTHYPGAGLLYNEYITYDISQVRLRYLFRVRM